MKQFNVLDRNLKLHQNYLIEASAGTGKTFSIQNILVNLLIKPHGEERPFPIQKILVVTFTQAATRDLKMRIRANIQEALFYLKSEDNDAEQVPDYLRACMEKGEEGKKNAIKQLQQALFSFDQAQIFTIHSFCARMLKQFALESDVGLHVLNEKESLTQFELMSIIRDFFRTSLHHHSYSPAQLDILLKGDPHQKKLLKYIQSGCEFKPYRPFSELYASFIEVMRSLKQKFQLQSEKMIADFQNQAEHFRNHKKGTTKKETLEKVIRFACLFDKEEWPIDDLDALISDGLVWVEALDPQLIKKTKGEIKLYDAALKEAFKVYLSPIIQEASDFAILLARMSGDCQHYLRHYQTEEEKFSPDDILIKMAEALKQSPFLKQVQLNYQAVIIDEFQDTDPLQWQIFQRLFLSINHRWNGFLYLVGDPKQSIYSFRQADIYTYLNAAQLIGEENCYTLNTNYRSQPNLVDALNMLFSSEHLKDFMPLPKKSMSLHYHPVSVGAKEHVFNDKRGAIHFFIADGTGLKKPTLSDFESDIFFPFIANEVKRIKKEKQFDFGHFAVLVRDRHQAMRLTEFFDAQGIPYVNQRGTSLASASALQSLIDLFQAILQPHDRGWVRIALASPLFGWNLTDLQQVSSLEPSIFYFKHLRKIFYEKGISTLFFELLQSQSKIEGQTNKEWILSRQGGLDFFHDVQQIMDIILNHQDKEWQSLEGIIAFLDQFQQWEQNSDERVKRLQDPEKDGVKILTLHYSKGLEFTIVFALGLVNRNSAFEELIPIEHEEKRQLTPFDEMHPDCLSYCEEGDAEKMRQFYVALTRAKLQLYIPVALGLSDQLKWGEASPMELFLARFKQCSNSYQGLYENIKNLSEKAFLEFLEKEATYPYITYTLDREVVVDDFNESHDEEVTCLVEPLAVKITAKPLIMRSFSSLSHHIEHQILEDNVLFSAVPQNYECDKKEVHTLPANRETGLLIHTILEKITFSNFQNMTHPEDALPLIFPFVEKSPYEQWIGVIAKLIFNVMKTPLPQISSKFSFAQLDQTQLYREMPFLFACQKDEKVEEIVFEQGVIKGVIDLIFYHEGGYYLVDWKTNWLGDCTEAYEEKNLHLAMQENAYFLQAALYREALKRYLKCVDSRPFEECFKGVFYLFLRGILPTKKTGIYYLNRLNYNT